MNQEELYWWRYHNDPRFREIQDEMRAEAETLPEEQQRVFETDHRMFNLAYEKKRLERYPNEANPSTVARARGNDVYAMEELAVELGLGNLDYDGPGKNSI